MSFLANAESINIPAKEGQIITSPVDSALHANNPKSFTDGVVGSLCGYSNSCPNIYPGNLVLTEKAVLFLSNNRVVKKINYEDIEMVEPESYGLTKGLRITTADYNWVLVKIDRKEVENIKSLIESKI